jgi:hypothetical protein
MTGCQGLDEGTRITGTGHGVSFWEAEKVLKLVVIVCPTLNIVKTTKLYSLKGFFFCILKW